MTDEIEKTKQINALKRRIKTLEQEYEKLRAIVGYDELQGWKPNPRYETQYGSIYAWLRPLYTYLNSNGHTNPDVRNKIIAITEAIISQLIIDSKYGIKIPNEPKEIDNTFFEKQKKSFERNYDECQICGENRITHYCHIIPRAEGGPYHIENYVLLCPLHHHLFDHHRLNQDEWETILKVIQEKMSSAYIYAKEVREKELEKFWTQPRRKWPE